MFFDKSIKWLIIIKIMNKRSDNMEKIKSKFKEEKGLSVMEFVFLAALIGTIIAIVGPYFRLWLVGTSSNPGFAPTVIERQMAGVDSSKNDKKIRIIEGCAPEIPVEKCNKLIVSN